MNKKIVILVLILFLLFFITFILGYLLGKENPGPLIIQQYLPIEDTQLF